MTGADSAYWAESPEQLLPELNSSANGLSSADAALRLERQPSAEPRGSGTRHVAKLLLRQFNNPMVLILLFGAVLSMLLRGWVDASILVGILLATGLFGFFQEYRATEALKALEGRLALQARVLRDGKPVQIPAAQLVPGDVIELAAGALIPADGVLLQATDFLVTEAALTGESMPVEKRPGLAPADAPLSGRNNCVFSGTSVRSGMARALVVAAGTGTQLGGIAAALDAEEPPTDFERGVSHFGQLLLRVMVVLVIAVLAVNSYLGRPVFDSLMFAVALAVGMTPELLPAIITVTLSAGARGLAARGVLVRRLASIENLGSMDILCTDKTGTLTEGTVTCAGANDADGAPSPSVLATAFLNAHFETGIENPLDAAILKAGADAKLTADGFTKLDEIPYDFVRKRLTIVIADAQGGRTMITKGSLKPVLDVATSVKRGEALQPLDDATRATVLGQLASKGGEGYRVLAVASRRVEAKPDYDVTDEAGFTLEGLLLFADPPKADAAEAVAALATMGVATKIITGDNKEVARHVASAVGITVREALTGSELAVMSQEALAVAADRTDLFCEIDPQQKERIILALQKRGRVVGYMGDGINDAPALHAADVGISVEGAVDVARQSADLVLLERDLGVLRAGIQCGRRTFANTQKYISLTTSANFGNMVSMALATPFLPFLPLLAKQVLFNNFLSDIPSVTISTDNVEPETEQQAEHWNIAELRRFMVVFGLISSVFDLATFYLLISLLAAGETEFQTAWFTVSLLTETLVVLSLRSRKSMFASHPSRPLLVSTLSAAALALLLPYVPFVAEVFSFSPLPPMVSVILLGLALAYVLTTEIAKRWFYRLHEH